MSDEEIVNHIIGVGPRTQRKSYFPDFQETQGKLDRRERLFRVVFESAYQYMGILDVEGRLLAANRVALGFIKAKMEDVEGMYFWETPWWKDPTSRAILMDLMQKAREQKEEQLSGVLVSHRSPDGKSEVFIDFSISPVFDEKGEIEFFIAEGRDMTQRKLAEDELQKKNAALERFIYTVSHDLKTPLVTIKAFLGFLEEDLKCQKEAQVHDDLGYIHEAANKMWRLLEELLTLARVGHKVNESVEIPLQIVVKEAWTKVEQAFGGIDVTVEITQEPVWLVGDHQRLVEIFQNILDNAVKFMGDQPEPTIWIGIEILGGEFVIFVRDNGSGIDPRHQSKLFGLFEKLDKSQPGTGIGLAMVRRIVELHGGKIWVESGGIGCGTTFRFTLAKTQLRRVI